RLQPRGLADAEHEQPGGERIERAGVSDFLDLRAFAELLHHVVRGDACLLIDQKEPVDFRLRRLHGRGRIKQTPVESAQMTKPARSRKYLVWMDCEMTG